MKTLIISTSLNPKSKGFILCQKVAESLSQNKDQTVELIDLREYELPHVMKGSNPKIDILKQKLETADNFILGMAVYNYNVNDSFASFVGGLIPKKQHALYGLVVAAGGDMSYLASTAAHQMLMTHNRMIPLPRILYGGKDWDGVTMTDDLGKRVDQFSDDFYVVGKKLI
jgi:multimeric flavodoxin WrbA